MSLKKMYNLTIAIMAILLVVTIFLLLNFVALLNKSNKINNDSVELVTLSHDMLHVNDYLVKLMKIYMVNNDPKILDEYFSILDDYESLNGKLDKMTSIGLNDSEVNKVDELLDILDILADIESAALDALDQGDKDTAVSIIYGTEYADNDNRLAQITRGLINDITNRVRTESSDIQNQINTSIIFIIIYLTVAITLFIVLQCIERRRVLKPIAQIQSITDSISEGNIHLKLVKLHNDEIGVLIDHFNIMIDGIKAQSIILEKMSDGDYTNEIHIRSSEDLINNAINQLSKSTNMLVSKIKSSAEQVSTGASQISLATQIIATNTANEETYCVTANKLMQESVDYNAKMMDAMQDITLSYDAIKKVMRLIDTIALQTNVLALNSGVEAARAGEAGKSFAIIADETRELAKNVAEAAKKTEELIEDGALRVQIGSEFATKVNEALALSTKQIDIISSTISSMASECQESAASADEMASQATMLTEIISQFALNTD